MPIEIHTKTGRETTLVEILNAYKKLYPKKFEFFMDGMKKLRQVQKNSDGSFVDKKGRWARISIRVPTELFLFIGRHIPEFGRDHKDVELLQVVAKDLVSTETKLSGRKRVYRLNKEAHVSAERGDDSPELIGRTSGVRGLSAGEQVSP
jgi:hypothetical protein